MQRSIGLQHYEIFLILGIAEIPRGPECRRHLVVKYSIRGFDTDGSTEIFVDQRIESVLYRNDAAIGGGILSKPAKDIIRSRGCFAAV